MALLHETIVFAAIFATTFVVGFAGNLLVIISILVDRSMRNSSMNVILLNLAVADLLNLCVNVPEISHLLADWSYEYPFGDAMCRLLRYGGILGLYASVLFQVAVCVER